MKPPASSRWSWGVFGRYLGILVVLGLLFAVGIQTLFPNVIFSDPPFDQLTDTEAALFLGVLMLMIIGPILGGVRSWRVSEMFFALAVIGGLFIGNVGFAIGMSLFSLLIYYATARCWQIVLYYTVKPPQDD